MGARHKLNIVVVWTCLIVSALVGLAAESWGVFWGVLAVTIGGYYTAGDIRPNRDVRLPRVGFGKETDRRPTRNGRR